MEEPNFSAPIAGMGMTHELGARPWQNPPKLVTIDEVIQDYLVRMQDESFIKQLSSVLESGVPITTIANSIQLAGVMEGRHSVDLGMLVIPILMEMMMLLGDKAGVKYNTGTELDTDDEQTDATIASVLEELEQGIEDKGIDLDNTEEESTDTESESMGLMSRRTG